MFLKLCIGGLINLGRALQSTSLMNQIAIGKRLSLGFGLLLALSLLGTLLGV